MPQKPRFDIQPRYTPGSPALVNNYDMAHSIARSESKAYYEALRSSLDPQHEKARKLGLGGIIRELWEANSVLHYRDLLTGERGKIK